MNENFTVPVMKTIKETAKILGLSKYFVRQLVLQNKIKYVKSGTKFLINLENLINYLNSGSIENEVQRWKK